MSEVRYSPEVAQRICEGVATGMSMERICSDSNMPDVRTVWKWLVRHKDFADKYDDAKVKQMEVFAHDIIHLADECPRDADAVAKAKLQVHARQWLMGKLKPKKYGDSTTIKGDADNPLTLNLALALDSRITAARAAPVIEHVASESVTLAPVVDAEYVESD